MKSMNISLPESMRTYVEEQIKNGVGESRYEN